MQKKALPPLLLVLLACIIGLPSTSASIIAVRGGPCGSDAGSLCPDNQCCSQWNNCGTTAQHCGDKCQTEWGKCGQGYIKGDGAASFVSPPSAVSPSISPKASNTAIKTRDQAIAAGASVAEPGQTCGPKADSVCPPGQCCSYSNYCGITAQHCMANACNAAWGFCGPEYVKETNVKVSQVKAAPDANNQVAQPGGQCGAVVDTICSGHQCCSSAGYCGNDADHCSKSNCDPVWSDRGACPGATGPVLPSPSAAAAAAPGPAATVLDVRTIIGIVSAVVVGVGATVGVAYTLWKWRHKHRQLRAAKPASRRNPLQSLPSNTPSDGLPSNTSSAGSSLKAKDGHVQPTFLIPSWLNRSGLLSEHYSETHDSSNSRDVSSV